MYNFQYDFHTLRIISAQFIANKVVYKRSTHSTISLKVSTNRTHALSIALNHFNWHILFNSTDKYVYDLKLSYKFPTEAYISRCSL